MPLSGFGLCDFHQDVFKPHLSASLLKIVRFALFLRQNATIGPTFKGHCMIIEDGTDRLSRRRHTITKLCCVRAQKSEDFNYTAAEARNLTNHEKLAFTG
jgi:hypothetical protein